MNGFLIVFVGLLFVIFNIYLYLFMGQGGCQGVGEGDGCGQRPMSRTRLRVNGQRDRGPLVPLRDLSQG